jgi:hypothetical protein
LRMLNNFIERSNSNSRYKKLAEVCKVSLTIYLTILGSKHESRLQ